jgi:hypothetical protein
MMRLAPVCAMRDAYDSPTDGGPEDKRLDALLDNWRDWMRVGRYGRGLPTKIPGLRAPGGQDFEGMVAEVDVRLARAIDAIIDSLPMAERTVIHHVKLASVWRLRVDVYATHQSARRMIRELMRQRRIE